MTFVLQMLGAAFVVLGLGVTTVSVIGTLRLRNDYLRLHAAGKSVVLGVGALLAGAIGTGDGALIVRAVIVAGVTCATAPVSAHIIARAIRTGGQAEAD